MLRLIAILLGIVFIFAGVAGFLPTFTTNGYVFGFFQVDTVHNIVSIVSGVLAIMASTNLKYTKLYFLVIGVVYLILAIAGFWHHGDLYIMHMNMSDNILNLAIGIVTLYIGLTAVRRI